MTQQLSVADVIYYNGTIYTADADNTVCSAIAISQGYILATGGDEIKQQFTSPETQLIDLNGQFMMPGLIDSHMHPFWGQTADRLQPELCRPECRTDAGYYPKTPR